MTSISMKRILPGLLSQANLPPAVSFHKIEGGQNNRAYKVIGVGWKAFLKIYFRSTKDLRDRYKREIEFSKFIWDAGIRSVPKLLATDEINGAALFEFVEGDKLEELSLELIERAIDFFSEINRHRVSAHATSLSDGSETRYSIAGHMNLVGSRIKTLESSGMHSDNFTRLELSPLWEDIKKFVKFYERVDLYKDIPLGDRCLSPSDFGFHNALINSSGQVKFFDFEYSGWDDPARMICDFFCQNDVPIPMRYFPLFVDKISQLFSNPAEVVNRTKLLMPVYHAKWCCIVLGGLCSTGISRRVFAGVNGHLDIKELKELSRRHVHSARAYL